MIVELFSIDNDASYFHSTIQNAEKDMQFLPCRALNKIASTSEHYGNYINEVVVGIRKNDLPSNPKGYEEFDKKIERKINEKTVKGKLNFITFFGEKTLDLKELLSFEDVKLLADFDQRYNDHYVALPFTLRFRQKDYKATDILEDITHSYEDFVSTVKTSNLLGYIPAYVSFRNLEKFIKIYLENNTTIKSPEGGLNFVPLMIDCKETSPDSLKRSLDKLLKLKNEYLKEGYYLFYYGFNPRTPGVNSKRDVLQPLAKDFLLAYLGFDVIGGSYARLHGGGGNSPATQEKGIFDPSDFKYHLEIVNKSDAKKVKPDNFASQTRYLRETSKRLQESPNCVIEELRKRKDAFDYTQSFKLK